MDRFNVSVPKKYLKDGVEKTAWAQVGRLVRFPAEDGKEERILLELNMFPDTKFGVFRDEPKKKEEEPVDTPF